MPTRRVLFAAVTLILLASLMILPGAGPRAETSLKAGIGYDFLSQQYFLDSVISEGADTILADWSLKTNYLDDLKGMLSARHRPFGDERLDLSGRWEQTADFLRLTLSEFSRIDFSGRRLYLASEYEIRSRVRGSPSGFGDDYWRAHAQARYSQRLTDRLDWRTQVRGEYTNFTAGSATSYDHSRLSGKMGLEALFGSFSTAQVDLFVARRNVSANSDLSYTSFGIEGYLWWLIGASHLDVSGRLERKDYSAAFNEDDYMFAQLSTILRLRLGGSWMVKSEADLELLDYAAAEAVVAGYRRVRLLAMIGAERDNVSLLAGPQIEHLAQDRATLGGTEDYFETGGKIAVEVFHLDLMFLTLESTTGWRNHLDDGGFWSDFLFERLSLVGNVHLPLNLTWDIFFSAEWEWHERESDNSRLYLLSTSLTRSL